MYRFLLLFFVIYTVSSSGSLAQKNFNKWVFGNKAGLDFNYSPPQAFEVFNFSHLEGTSVWCDSLTGELMLYTDGIKVWINGLESSGLAGGTSTAQTQIVPVPGDPDRFYIFTNSTQLDPEFFRYTIVRYSTRDIQNLNIPIKDSIMEAVAAVPHENGNDYWILVHEARTNRFFSYLLTSSGLNLTPVISEVGPDPYPESPEPFDAIGRIKVCRDLEKIAFDCNKGAFLFKIDRNTGDIHSPLQIGLPEANERDVFSMEFSEDGRLLYVGSTINNQNGTYKIHQFDVSVYDSASVAASVFKVIDDIGALQLGPDGKIYICHSNKHYMSVIHNPGGKGTACNIEANTLYLGEANGFGGLPAPVYPDRPYISFNYDKACEGDTVKFTLYNYGDILDSVRWDFGHPSSGQANFSSQPEPEHRFQEYGFYTVKLIAYKTSLLTGAPYIDSVIRQVVIDSIPETGWQHDTIRSCNTFSLFAVKSVDPNFSHLKWSTPAGEISGYANVIADRTGNYTIDMEYKGCRNKDSVYVIINEPGYPFLGWGFFLCEGDTATLDAGEHSGKTITWWDGTNGRFKDITIRGKYWVTVTDTCGNITSDTLSVTGNVRPATDFPEDTLICPGETIKLTVFPEGSAVYWNNIFGDSVYYASSAGTYVSRVSNFCGTYYDTIRVSASKTSLDLGADTVLCDGDSFLLQPDIPGDYTWHNGSSGSQFKADTSGAYFVKVVNKCGTFSDTLYVTAVAGPSDKYDTLAVCMNMLGWIYSPDSDALWYKWHNGDTRQFPELYLPDENPMDVYVDVGKECGSYRHHFHYTALKDPYFEVDSLWEICTGEIITLKPFVVDEGVSIMWYPGFAADSLNVSVPGMYRVSGANSCRVLYDTVYVQEKGAPEVNFAGDTTLCEGEVIELILENSDATTWSDGTTGNRIIVEIEGTYRFHAVNSCNELQDTVNVNYINVPEKVFPADTILCPQIPLMLSASEAETYLWNTGHSSRTISISEEGFYSVEMINRCGSNTDSFMVYSGQISLLPSADTLLCEGESFTIQVNGKVVNIEWEDGSASPERYISSSGTYVIQASNFCGSFYDTVHVMLIPSPSLDILLSDTVVCDSESVIAEVITENTDWFSWDSGDTARIRSLSPGSYGITAGNKCQVLQKTFLIKEENCCIPFIPNLITPNKDGKNDSFDIACEGFNIEIYNRWGTLVYSSENYQGAWPEEEIPTGLYFYHVSSSKRPSLSYKGYILVEK